MANIFRVYRDSQVTTDRIRAEAAAQSIAQPSRVVNVFSGAANVAPNFDTFSGALTYANSLTPSTSEPVAIRLFAQSDGTPYEITGPDDWYALALDGIYVSSPFRDVFSTTTLPTTLPQGMSVMYMDGNGTESLWVGNADGEAWPAVGYKEVRCSYYIPPGTGGFANRTLTIHGNTTGENLVVTDTGNGVLNLGLSVTELTVNNATIDVPYRFQYSIGIDFNQRVIYSTTGIFALLNLTADYIASGSPFAYPIIIRVYPS